MIVFSDLCPPRHNCSWNCPMLPNIYQPQIPKKLLGWTESSPPSLKSSHQPPQACHGFPASPPARVHRCCHSPLCATDSSASFPFISSLLFVDPLRCCTTGKLGKLQDVLPSPIWLEFYWILRAALIGLWDVHKHRTNPSPGSMWMSQGNQYGYHNCRQESDLFCFIVFPYFQSVNLLLHCQSRQAVADWPHQIVQSHR